MHDCSVGDWDSSDFMDALRKSGCATGLVKIEFGHCQLGTGGVRILASYITRGAFPALNDLSLYNDLTVTEAGVLALAEGSLSAPQTCLTSLNIWGEGMGKESVAAVASLIRQGRFEQLAYLNTSENGGISDQGVMVLAQAIEARGLPKLDMLELQGLDTARVTLAGIQGLAISIIDGSPVLGELIVNSEYQEMVDEMRQAVADIVL